jgi:hypothetical protein
MAYSFTDILSQAQRRGQLTGRKVTASDQQGIASGYFQTALERTLAARKLALQEQALKDSQSNFADELALRKADMEAQQDAAKKATTQGYVNTGVQTLGTAALLKGLPKAAEGAHSLGTEALPGAVDQGYYDIFSPSGATVAETGAEAGTLGSTAAAETGAVAGTGAAETGAGTLAAEGAGTAAAAEGGATLGGAASAAGTAAPYALAGYLAAKYGGKYVEDLANKQSDTKVNQIGAGIGRTIQRPLEGIGEPVYNELLGGDDKTSGTEGVINTALDVMNPVGWVAKKSGCIIVTACTSPDSPEVNLTREYRDKFMDADQLRGYYMIAEKVVPKIEKSPKLKYFVRRYLVDNLIEYGAFALGKAATSSPKAALIALGFLALCRIAGKTRKQYQRANGEVF